MNKFSSLCAVLVAGVLAGPAIAAPAAPASAPAATGCAAKQQHVQAQIDIAKANGAVGTGPSAALTEGGDQSYMDLVQPWMNQLTHDKGLLVHVYTVDEAVDFKKVSEAGVDGIFTNRASELLKFYKRPAAESVDQILKRHDY